MSLLRSNSIDTRKVDEYATSEDFCKLFTEDMAGLYQLSFVLTADHEKAEQCFVAGLADCMNSKSVFKPWARSWAKRTIVKNAVRTMAPCPSHAGGTGAQIQSESDGKRQRTQSHDTAIASVLALRDFDRFVFAMSVFERYTEKECSVLLGCSQHDVREARLRALQQMAAYTEYGTSGHGDPIQPSSLTPEMLAYLGETTHGA
jgi:DNA-directed RNA polymerase specialized sigma24 family protein